MIKNSIIAAILCGAIACAALSDPRFASLKLTSVPDSCHAFLDDEAIGITPLEHQIIEPGKHRLRAVKKGYHLYVRELTFEGGKRVVGTVKLAAITQAVLDSVRQADSARAAGLPRLEGEIPPKKAVGGANVQPAEPVTTAEPLYPGEAKRNGVEGKVLVHMLIDTDGAVVRAELAKSSGDELLDFAAIDAAYQWKYRPAIAPGNKPVRVWKIEPFIFKLH